jgi:hypothetical protein
MNIFYRPKYQSEATQFLESLKAKDPQLDAKRLQGRSLLWTKPWTPKSGATTGQARSAKSPTFTRPTPSKHF